MNDLSRRLVRLEARAMVAAAETIREPHIIRFVDTDRTVASTLDMGTGMWTHFKDNPGDHRRQQLARMATDNP